MGSGLSRIPLLQGRTLNLLPVPMEVTTTLLQELSSPEPYVRSRTARLVDATQYRDPQVREQLVRTALEDPVWSVRLAALETLARYDGVEAELVPERPTPERTAFQTAMQVLTGDENWYVRQQAAILMSHLDPEETLERIRNLFLLLELSGIDDGLPWLLAERLISLAASIATRLVKPEILLELFSKSPIATVEGVLEAIQTYGMTPERRRLIEVLRRHPKLKDPRYDFLLAELNNV